MPSGKRGFLLGRACLALLLAGLRFIIHSGHMDQAPAYMGEAACVGGAGQVHTDGRAGGRVAAGPKGQERAGRAGLGLETASWKQWVGH